MIWYLAPPSYIFFHLIYCYLKKPQSGFRFENPALKLFPRLRITGKAHAGIVSVTKIKYISQQDDDELHATQRTLFIVFLIPLNHHVFFSGGCSIVWSQHLQENIRWFLLTSVMHYFWKNTVMAPLKDVSWNMNKKFKDEWKSILKDE